MVTSKTMLRYPGGKSRAVKILLPLIDPDADIVAPFLGGGSVELALSARGQRVIASDAFSLLVTFWQVMGDDALRGDLVSRLRGVLGKVDKQTFADYQRFLAGADADGSPVTDDTRVERAMKFFAVNRCSFSGATLSGGYSSQAASKRFTPSSVDRVEAYYAPLLSVERADCLDAIRAAGDGQVLFCDPPYALGGARDNLYGVGGNQHDDFDHEALAEAILSSGRDFVITYNDRDAVREMYSGCTITQAAWSYGMNASKKSSEIIITP